MSFCTVINCMDGRVQLPVIEYLRDRFGAEYVDSITEPGPSRILSEQSDTAAIDSIRRRLKISIENHKSCAIAVVAHHDCAGNPVSKEEQVDDLRKSVKFLRSTQDLPVIAIWIDESRHVEEIAC